MTKIILDKNNLETINHDGEVWFTSDTHFGHEQRVLLNRTDDTPARDRDQRVIEGINKHVQPDDTLYILGDFSVTTTEYNRQCFDAINCKNIHLIIGNNDNNDVLALPWASQRHLLNAHFTYYHQGQKEEIDLALCHYPLHRWHGDKFKVHHIYGHLHDAVVQIQHGATLADIIENDYTPLNLHDIKVRNDDLAKQGLI